MSKSWLFLVALVAACASSPKPQKQDASLFKSAVRAKPLDAEEVGTMVNEAGASISACYHRERLSTDKVSSYVFELDIPNDGLRQKVTRVSASIENQTFLEECVTKVLSGLRFPSHSGKDLKVRIPIDPA